MDTSILHPPNGHLLSNNVICGVKQRIKANNSCVVAQVRVNAQSDSERQQCAVSDAKTTLSSSKSPRRQGQSVNIAELLIIGEKLHRERRRNNQRRYRKKQEDYAASLKNDTRQLRKEIEKLQHQRRSHPTKDVISIVVEYFDLLSQDYTAKSQFSDFVQATMAPDVVCNAGRGTEAAIRGMRVFQWFNDVEIKLENLQMGINNSVVAHTTTFLTFTERTLHYVFPHLFNTRDENIQLPTKLLGQRIVVRGSTRFGWDGSCNVTSAWKSRGRLSCVREGFQYSRFPLEANVSTAVGLNTFLIYQFHSMNHRQRCDRTIFLRFLRFTGSS